MISDAERGRIMFFTKAEAEAKVAKKVQLHDFVNPADGVRVCFSKEAPAGTTGSIIHANFACRFTDPDTEAADVFQVVIAWDLPHQRIDMLGKSEYGLFITELE